MHPLKQNLCQGDVVFTKSFDGIKLKIISIKFEDLYIIKCNF